MKTKETILKMTKKEIEDYKRADDLNRSEEDNCYNCNNCNNCNNCYNCYNCYACRNAKNLKYSICNVGFSKEEYNKKIKELN